MLRSEIAKVLKISEFESLQNDTEITILLTDSRSLTFAEETLFFAIESSSRDGHNYIPELYQRGVRNFVIHHPIADPSSMEDALFFLVDNTMSALQMLAAHHRLEMKMPVIGITGSNGKTIVKDWLYQLMRQDKRIVRSPRSYNSQIGVPLSLWLMQSQDELAIIEAGVSKNGEMKRLEDMIRPTIGIFTNLGVAHDEGFGSTQEKCLEKLRLFRRSDVLIYNSDNELIADCVRKSFTGSLLLEWSSKNKEKPLFISSIKKGDEGTEIEYNYIGIKGSFRIPMSEDSSIENAIHCLAVMLYFGISGDKISERMLRLEPVQMRLEVKQGERNCLIINDSYNNDYNSFSTALDYLKRLGTDDRREKVLILSDFFEYDALPAVFYNYIASIIAKNDIQRVIAVGPELALYLSHFKPLRVSHYYSTDSFISSLEFRELKDNIVLIKGANRFRFERITEALEQKRHETILEVDLAAMVNNFKYYRSLLHPSTKMICMVKAFAYGSGSYEVARALQDAGADYVAVAVADEGVELRKAGIKMPIMVMNPEMGSLSKLFAYNLEPEIYNFRILKAVVEAASLGGESSFPIHIKFDTGMHRLGFELNEIEPLIKLLNEQNCVRVRSAFSHLVGADEERFDSFTLQQVELFKHMSKSLQEGIGYRFLRHILNSSGIESYADYQMDMVRLGIGLYGYSAYKSESVTPVGTLKSTILQIKEVEAGETIGYSRKGVLDRKTRIATIPIGYADGLNRHLGNRTGHFWINNHKAPIIGNICMDLTMVDVTDIPYVREGDEVIIFSPQHPASELSDLLNTIPYEVISGVSSRVNRIYYREG